MNSRLPIHDSRVQECDARNDAMKDFSRAHKKNEAEKIIDTN